MFELFNFNPLQPAPPWKYHTDLGGHRELPKRERYPREVPATVREDSRLPTVFRLLDPAMGGKRPSPLSPCLWWSAVPPYSVLYKALLTPAT